MSGVSDGGGGASHVPCVRYLVTVSNGDFRRLALYEINEVFVPSHGVLFNVDRDGHMNAGFATEPRLELNGVLSSRITTDTLPCELADLVRALCEKQDAAKRAKDEAEARIRSFVPNEPGPSRPYEEEHCRTPDPDPVSPCKTCVVQ